MYYITRACVRGCGGDGARRGREGEEDANYTLLIRIVSKGNSPLKINSDQHESVTVWYPIGFNVSSDWSNLLLQIIFLRATMGSASLTFWLKQI